MNSAPFSTLSLRPELLTSIATLGYESMTPVQAQTLPHLLSGKDLIAQARTGSGKTAAFAIGLLNKLEAQAYCTQALVLCPTRELADQVAAEIRRLASTIPNIKLLTLCGGKPMGPQLASLRRDPHIVVGTPGRILKHIEKETLHLNTVETLVLDEADRMLDMGFHDEIMQIIGKTAVSRQTLLFSATYPDGIKKISDIVQRDPVDIRVEASHHSPDIDQIFFQVEKSERVEMLFKVIAHYQPKSSLVFCNTKQQCQELAEELRQHDLHVLALHGDLEQFERDQVLTQFAGKSSSILIATDVAARGLDVKELAAVINFELSHDPEIHIHRIGRTARAGSKGLAVSLFTDSERRRLQAIEEYQGSSAEIASTSTLKIPKNLKLYPPMITLFVNGGRKEKVRAGDLLGALTASGEIAGEQIGKITLFDKVAYVAIEQKVAKLALTILADGKIKGRKFRVRLLR
ncbi:MAG: ATP-dependent RNA helicase DbpA [SAR86 cluster bacterium]|uniref:ATP-dependent RNA helicase DbpA n=1 Tax=SAR86 cluster bacterium TaxID=2030880 RepID=A0A2A5CG30_9GAMM|nr:MAG: ATP-dependent RNA helicase DbpA [SAR86 cluster bacterium]